MRKSFLWIMITLLCITSGSVLFAVDIDSVIEQAKEQSEILAMYTLDKESGQLSLSLSNIEDVLSVEVNGSAGYEEMTFDSSTVDALYASADVELVFPDDNDTTLTFSTGTVAKDTASSSYIAYPSISLESTFSSLDDGDILDALNDSLTELEIESSYLESESSFVSSIYDKAVSILTAEKNILSTQRNIDTLQTTMENTLALGTYSPSSTKYKSYEVQMKNYQRLLSSYEKQLELAKEQFTQLTSLEWEDLDSMEIPSLSFTALETGNSDVIIAQLELEIAKEELALFNRQTVISGSSRTVPSFNVSGSAQLNYEDINSSTDTSYDLGLDGMYYGSSFSVGAGVGVNIDDTGSLTPEISISGSWNNSTSSSSDEIQRSSLQNDITSAEIAYNQAMLDYRLDAQELSNDILDYNQQVEEFLLNKEYNQSVLEIQQEAFDLGLITESELNEAVYTVSDDLIDEKIYALQGFMLEEEIRQMQF